MAEITYLAPGEQVPIFEDDQLWLTIEASDDGRFFGTGCGRKESGEAIFYVSLAEDDISIERALSAAQDWAAQRGIPRIWVQLTPCSN